MSLPIKSQSEDLGGEAVKNMNPCASEKQLWDSWQGPPPRLTAHTTHRPLYLPELIPFAQETQTLVTRAQYSFSGVDTENKHTATHNKTSLDPWQRKKLAGSNAGNTG